MSKRRSLLIVLVLFLGALSVRLIVWQNNRIAIDGVQYFVTTMYVADATNLALGDIRSFLAGPDPPSDAMILAHPPGYPILMAPLFAMGADIGAFRLFQILLSSLAPVLAFMIAAALFDETIGIAAGSVVALSPQAAYYSSVLLPDGLCVLPILIGVYFLIKGVREPRLVYAILAGAGFAGSCWLRSNAMLLPFFAAAVAYFVISPGVRVRFVLGFLSVFLVLIAPVTIRNAVVFRSFIPLSLGMGHMLVIGLGEHDETGALGLPTTDEGETALDARRDDRPDYYGLLYSPDGVRRERERTSLAVSIIKTYPGWYLYIVAHRAINMLRMERVPVIATQNDEVETPPPLFYQLNKLLKPLQKAFVTAVIIPFFILGLWAAFRKRERRSDALLLAVVAVYYMCVQSFIYTEYRFFVPLSYVLLIFAAVGAVYLLRQVRGAFMSSTPAGH